MARLAPSLIAALALHASVAVGARWLPARAVEQPRTEPEAISIELEESPPTPTEPTRTEARDEGAQVAPSPATRPPSARAEPLAATAAAGAEEPPAPGAPADAETASGAAGAADLGPNAADAPRGPRRPVELGLGSRPALLPDRPKSGGWQTGARVAGGLTQGLEARDQARGVGRGGLAATLARDATLARGPREGQATFLIETDRTGAVRSVVVTDVGADGSLWSEVAAWLKAALASKRLRVPPGAAGLRVSVRIDSRVVLPSGSKVGEAVQMAGPGVGFDVADIGAKPRRIVSARVLGESVL